jgi:hypothetical protein
MRLDKKKTAYNKLYAVGSERLNFPNSWKSSEAKVM